MRICSDFSEPLRRFSGTLPRAAPSAQALADSGWREGSEKAPSQGALFSWPWVGGLIIPELCFLFPLPHREVRHLSQGIKIEAAAPWLETDKAPGPPFSSPDGPPVTGQGV